MLGMTARQAYTYISIADKLSEDFAKSTSQIGIQKLYLLAMASEETRTEIAAHTDLENTTVRELKAQIAALKMQSEQAEKSRTDAEKRAQGWYDKYSEQGEQIASLNAQIAEQSERIDELESRPVEVAVPEPSREVQNMQDAMRRINREHEEWSARMQDEHIREIQRLHADYRRKMEAMKTDGSAVFSVYLDAAADAVSRLSDWVKAHGDSTAKKQSAEMLRTFWLEITDNGGQ
jgi:chromosome segregation ATPase